MKRDPAAIRAILFEMEESPYSHFLGRFALSGILEPSADSEAGTANQQRAEHMRWMIDDGLLALVPGSTIYVRVTAKGCDFLDAVRDTGIWNKTVSQVSQAGGNATLEIIKTVATAYAKKIIKDKTDLDF